MLQALVRDGILRGIRGPHGGYELARGHSEITAEDILRAASSTDDVNGFSTSPSALVGTIVQPALAEAERSFSSALSRINVDDMTRRALVKQ